MHIDGYYAVVREFYGVGVPGLQQREVSIEGRRARRSNIPLMNHIYEGVAILDHLNATDETKKAFIIHPVFQGDGNIQDSLHNHWGTDFDWQVILLAVEYRKAANSYLPNEVGYFKEELVRRVKEPVIPVDHVRNMLIADKVQNYKDFLKYQNPISCNNHQQLCFYFNDWMEILGINNHFRQQLSQVAAKDTSIRA